MDAKARHIPMKPTPKENKLKRRVEELETVLRIVALGIRRDKSMNACWLTGEALAVHAVEAALGKKRKAMKYTVKTNMYSYEGSAFTVDDSTSTDLGRAKRKADACLKRGQRFAYVVDSKGKNVYTARPS